MSTLNEITYNIFSSIRPHLTDDEDLPIEKIEHDVNLKRSLFIRNELNKSGRTIDMNYIQTLGCLELELGSPTDCCVDDVDCFVLRTKDIIPNTIELHNKKLITRVAPIVKTKVKFNFVSYDRFLHSGNGQFNKNDIFATLHNGRIYLKSNNENINLIEKIALDGIFEDPREVIKFKNCDGSNCFSADSKYPLNQWMEDYIKQALIEEYFKLTLRSTKDNTNDGKSESTDAY
jgi:hypothetical protein